MATTGDERVRSCIDYLRTCGVTVLDGDGLYIVGDERLTWLQRERVRAAGFERVTARVIRGVTVFEWRVAHVRS